MNNELIESSSQHVKNNEPLKKEFIRSCHLLYTTGLVSGVGGNLSMRLGQNALVTPTGFSLRDVSEDNIITVDLRGKVITGGIPTKDIDLHTGILRSRPEINVVCHTHGVHVIAAGALMEPGKESLPPVTPGFVYFAYPLVLIPFMVPGSKELTTAVSRHFTGTKSPALLLQNHGLVTVGKSFQEALNIAEEIDEAARIWLLTKGRAGVISPEDVDRIKGL